jgi:DNA-binding NarL/FixJ family response regulator
MTYSILITDDHGVIRDGLRALLNSEPDLQVVGEASNSEQAIRLTEQLRPDIVLMDISMPGENGIEASRKICKEFPNTRVLILTVHEEKELLEEALRSGASGYILKQAVKSELINAIHAVARGDLYVHSSVARAFISLANPEKPTEKEELTLTAREVEILKLLAQGYTNGQIAKLLQISVRTVEFHRSNLMDKLNIGSRVEMVRYVAEHGLI